MSAAAPEAVLVLPHLRIQNANAIASPLTHGFPSITAFMGFMWALERKLCAAGVPLALHGVGVICHHHQELVSSGYVRKFNLTRNPVAKDGSTAAIVEEGRMYLDVTLVFTVSEKRVPGALARLLDEVPQHMQAWAEQAGGIAAGMRVAGGSVLPVRRVRGQRSRAWMSALPAETSQGHAEKLRQWRRSWLPGFALVGRDDLLAKRLERLRLANPEATLLDAWLDASRFNHLPQPEEKETPEAAAAPRKRRWADPDRSRGSGWTVPLNVGYAALSPAFPAGEVQNTRDTTTSLRFVESLYSIGQWVAPHRIARLSQLIWTAQTNEAAGIYRCVSGGGPADAQGDGVDDDDVFPL